jgi:predicted nucleic acid-binding Zn ribbon protein
MPKYDFKCPVCQKTKETDSPDGRIECSCQTPPNIMKRVYSFGGTVLKGFGWYSVDKRKTDGGKIGLD